MKLLAKFAILSACLVLMGIGCKPPQPPKPLVEVVNPPAFGTAGKADLGSFLEGKWGFRIVVDPNMSKAMGMDAVKEELESDPIADIFTFSKDGTFTLKVSGKGFKVAGKWSSSGPLLQLAYETIDGKTIQQALDEGKKLEEGGTQSGIAKAYAVEGLKKTIDQWTSFRLGDDKTKFILQGPSLLTGEMGDTDHHLVRMEADKKG